MDADNQTPLANGSTSEQIETSPSVRRAVGAGKYGRKISDYPLADPTVRLYGKRRALAEGWTLRHVDINIIGNPLTYRAWMDFRRAGAAVIGVAARLDTMGVMIGRTWWFGIPPPGWTGDYAELVVKAGMIVGDSEYPRTFRWLGQSDLMPQHLRELIEEGVKR
jgi:hypothetical protein